MTKKRKAQAVSNKGSKKVSTSSNEILPQLPTDALSVIQGMLHPKEMLNFACASRELISLLTYEHVIRSGVVMDKLRAKKRKKETELEKIMEGIKEKRIFIPSPLRLLRLLVGKRCEKCGKEATMMPTLCVYMCGQCQFNRAFVRMIHTKYPPPNPIREMMASKTVAKEKSHGGMRQYVMTRPYTTKDGEQAGALVSMRDMEDLAWKDEGLSDFLDGKVDDDLLEELNDTYLEAQECYTCIDEERELKAKILEEGREERQLKAQAARNRKREKILVIIEKVKELLPDTYAKDAMTYKTWEETSSSPPKFRLKPVYNCMLPYMKAPTKATDDVCREVAESIRNEIDGLYAEYTEWEGDSWSSDRSFLHFIRRNHYQIYNSWWR